MSEEIQFADLEYQHKIEKIYHLSDIHIRLQKRHDEYKQVFKNLYNDLKNELKHNLKGDSNKGVIIITGDILHSKTELSPECVSITADFFQQLAKIMPLIIIAGNHDANLNNNNRLDSLTPIVEKVIRRSQCYYLRQSGFYKFGNIIFGITSVFDYNFIKAEHIESLELTGVDHKIALFHGRVDGAITDTGSIMEGERGINKKSFEGYDYTLLGDIHKHQFLIPGKMAYAGSLIQQNHGESPKGHGFLIWDLKHKKVEHRDVANEYGYVTLKIRDGRLLKNKDVIVPSKCYLRLEIDNKTSRVEQKKILDSLCEKRTILELIQTNITVDTSKENIGDTREDGEDGDGEDEDGISVDKDDGKKQHATDVENMLRSLSFNVSNHQYQNSEIEKYLKSKNISDELIEKVKNINLEYNQNILVAEALIGGSWKIKLLEFGNLFCYGPDNQITFDKAKGIVGLVAPNHSGKSSILDVILYTLFDKTSRKGSGKEIMRLGEKTFKSKIEIEMADKTFVITKKGTKKTGDTMSVAIDFGFYSKDVDTGKIVSTKLTGKTPAETKKVIESYFGTFDDMIMTSMSLQNNNTQFADSTSAEKRKEFEKLLRIDIFEKLKDLSMEHSREKKAIIKHLTGETPEDALKSLLDEHLTLTERITELEGEIIESKEELSELRGKESGTMIRLSTAMNGVPAQYKELVKQGGIGGLEKTKAKMIRQINDIKVSFGISGDGDEDDGGNKWEDIVEKYSMANLEEWKTKEAERKNKLEEVERKLDKLTRGIHPIKKDKENITPPKMLLEDLSILKDKKLDEAYKLKKKIKKLKECDWEEKNMVNGVCNEIVEKMLVNHPRKGKLSIFYDDLEKMIVSVLDTRYQAGSEQDLKESEIEYKNIMLEIDQIDKDIQSWKDFKIIQEWKSENLESQEKIDILMKKKKKLNKSEFDITGYMDYQKLIKLEKELDDLESAFDNLKIYSDCASEVNEIMSSIIKLEKLIDNMEEERGNIKGSIGVVETDMKNIRDKKKKMETVIMELDIITTYQDCLKAVPFIIIDKVIPQLERTINMMLTSLVNFTINFIVTEKELNVYITRPHGQIPLSNASGFEKFVGSLFLRIGLIKISNLPKANFLAIDEGWSNFDYENMNNVGMIMDYLRGEFDFVILVSHLQTMREQTDLQININVEKKTGGVFGLSSVHYPNNIKNQE